jgi:uncharacterized repeat protein (TIGR01451 family)
MGAAVSGDQIVFGGLQGDINLTAGELSSQSKSLTIDGAGSIVINAAGSSRVFHVFSNPGSGASLTLKGLWLSNGFTSAGNGGAILHFSGRLTLDAVRVTNGYSLWNGGGIAVGSDAELIVRQSVIEHSRALDQGGGIYSLGSVTLVNSTLESNTAAVGGGIRNDIGSNMHMTGSTVARNTVSTSAAGIENEGVATITSSTISSNVVTGPTGTGGIRHVDGQLTLVSSTVTKNIGGSIGGLAGFAPVTVQNSILIGNQASPGSENCHGSAPPFISGGFNLVESGTGCELFAAGDIHLGAGMAFTTVLEDQLADNGGPTKTHALIVRGRAIDAGYCPGLTTDQRGFARPVDDSMMPNVLDACDIGAYEAQGPSLNVADLMVSQSVSKTSVKQGEKLTYFIRVQNLGPQTAPNVVMQNVLSSGATFVSVKVNKGTTTAPPLGETGTVTWNLGDMADQADDVAEIQVTVIVKGKTTITNTASVSGDVADPNQANNSAAITVSVAAGKGKK